MLMDLLLVTVLLLLELLDSSRSAFTVKDVKADDTGPKMNQDKYALKEMSILVVLRNSTTNKNMPKLY